jgi:peptide chain release factor 1
MKTGLLSKLEYLHQRLQEVEVLLSDPNVTQDMNQYRKITKENAELTPVVENYLKYLQVMQDLDAAKEMLNDSDLKELGQEEMTSCKLQLDALHTEIQRLLLPQDPNDEKDVIVEIRAGTGGDESAIFAGDLLRMYMRYAERQRWQVEIMSESVGEIAGYKEVIIRISGQRVYSRLKFESGGHRVQRVPDTETQGRIHTSACTVAVMPEADELEDIQINPADLRVDTFRASGAGGQHINKTDSAVRLTHIPTGIVVECQDDRSQHRNRDKAMRVLATRIKNAQVAAQQSKEASMRKDLVGSGDRSDRIRTYNFPQGRISDHRINLTLYKIDAMMDGDITDLIDALVTEHQAEQLAQLAQD